MQRPQRMHLLGSRTMEGFVTMRCVSRTTEGSGERRMLNRLTRCWRSQFWLRGQLRQSRLWFASMSWRMAIWVLRTIGVSVCTSMPSQHSVEQAA